MVTPVLPELVLEVWDWCVGEKEEEEDEGEGEGEEGAEGEGEEEGGEENILWHLVLAEMCLAFSNKPMPSFKDYDGCCKRIDPFRQAVGNAMADRIHFGEGRGEEGGGKRVKLDLDRGD